MSKNKLDWSKSVNAEARKRIKELGEKLDEQLHAAGISDLEMLRMKQTLAARIIARVFGAEVRQLERFAIESEVENVPELSKVLDEKDNNTED